MPDRRHSTRACFDMFSNDQLAAGTGVNVTLQETRPPYTLTWQPNHYPPSQAEISQVYGLCLTSQSQLVLVSKDGNDWTLPGGRPEAGDSPTDTLIREVLEEACATVTSSTYLGAQRVDDSATESTYYQLRYLAHVELRAFEPKFEMLYRRCENFETARHILWGGSSQIGHALIGLAANYAGKY